MIIRHKFSYWQWHAVSVPFGTDSTTHQFSLAFIDESKILQNPYNSAIPVYRWVVFCHVNVRLSVLHSHVTEERTYGPDKCTNNAVMYVNIMIYAQWATVGFKQQVYCSI